MIFKQALDDNEEHLNKNKSKVDGHIFVIESAVLKSEQGGIKKIHPR